MILAIALIVCSNITAWERQAAKDCDREETLCRRKAAKKCEKDTTGDCGHREKGVCGQKSKRCKREAEITDEESFQAELSPRAYSKFQTLTRGQKIKAMDYADNNKMYPSDAVDKASR